MKWLICFCRPAYCARISMMKDPVTVGILLSSCMLFAILTWQTRLLRWLAICTVCAALGWTVLGGEAFEFNPRRGVVELQDKELSSDIRN